MYMQHTREQMLIFAGLPPDYRVSGVLACGTWDLTVMKNQLPHLHAALDETVGPGNYTVTRIAEPMIGHAYEIRVGNLNYWFVPVMGAALMGQYLHMACLFGSERNILLGTCGGLTDTLHTGDLIIPLQVTGNDNARMYSRDNRSGVYEPSTTLTKVLTDNMHTSRRVAFGRTVTCEMIFGETTADVQGWIEDGYLGVEMEAAITYSISAEFRVPATALLVVDDNLAASKTLIDQDAQTASKREKVKSQQYLAGVKTLLSADMGI